MSVTLSFENVGSIIHFILSDQVLWLVRRWRIELSGSGDCFGSEDVLFEETLLDKLFQVLPEGPAMDSLLSLAVIIEAIFFCFGK